MTRPIPDAPNVEFERKAAKALLRELRRREPVAAARAQAIDDNIGAGGWPSVPLADAQRIIAREYGFASWTRLTRYFRMVAEEGPSHPMSRPEERGLEPPDWLEGRAKSLVAEHRARRRSAGYMFARYLPRLFGAPLSEVYGSPITIDEAKFAIAQREGFRTWEKLLAASIAQQASRNDDPWQWDAQREATHAIRDGDLARLQRVVEQHPEWRETGENSGSHLDALLDSAIRLFGRRGRDLPPDDMVDWLLGAGANPHPTLEHALEGHIYMLPEQVAWLLARGADPHATNTHGLPMLETAILRWWSGEAVDVLARHVEARDALWISAGLGDAAGVARWFDASGRLRPEARNERPPFHRAGGVRFPMHPDADEEELLLEVLWVATLNGRREVIRQLTARGAKVDSLRWEMPLVVMAVGNGWLNAVEALVEAGADLDLRGHYNGSAREMARERWLDRPEPTARRIVELVGLDPDALQREQRAVAPTPAVLSDRLHEVFERASLDAAMRGRESVDEESLFFGLMQARRNPGASYVRWARGFDARRFLDEYGERLRNQGAATAPADAAALSAPSLALAPDAQALVDAAIAARTANYREDVGGDALLWALVRDDDGFAARLLAAYGTDLASLREEAGRYL